MHIFINVNINYEMQKIVLQILAPFTFLTV